MLLCERVGKIAKNLIAGELRFTLFKKKSSSRAQVYYPDDLESIWSGKDGENWRKADVSHRLSIRATKRADGLLKNINAVLLSLTLFFVFLTLSYATYGLYYKQLEETYFVDGTALVCTIDKAGNIVPKSTLRQIK